MTSTYPSALCAQALRHCCKAVILAATEVRAHSDEKGAAVEEGAVAEAERGETKKNDQREMVALGGAVHLTLGVLRIARLSQQSCVLLIKEGAVPALCDALVLRVNNPVRARACVFVRVWVWGRRPRARFFTHKEPDPFVHTLTCAWLMFCQTLAQPACLSYFPWAGREGMYILVH